MDSVTVLPIRRSIPISVAIVTRWDFLFARSETRGREIIRTI